MAAMFLNALYLAALAFLAPWWAWQAVRAGKYRQGWGARLWGNVPPRSGDEPCLWLHAVSVGEVNLLGRLIEQIARDRPAWTCVISTGTRAGYELACNKYAGRRVFYCPLDLSWAVRRAMRRVRPTCLVLAELELWPNLVNAAKRHGARVAVVNGRLSEHSHRGYRRIRPLIRRLLANVDLVAVQNEEYRARFLDLGAREEAVLTTGSMKYDGANADRGNAVTAQLAALAGLAPGDRVWVAGSTQEPEESIVLAAFRELSQADPQLRLILAPRHPERFAPVARMLAESGLPWELRSALNRLPHNPAARILLVDTVGELGAWWGTAHVAFVGGSLGDRGGQNMIEPAAYGAAVCFGPNTRNFRDIVAAMLDRRAAVVVPDGAALTAFVRRCFAEPAFAAELGAHARSLVASQLGAVRRTCDLLYGLLEGAPTAAPRQPERQAA